MATAPYPATRLTRERAAVLFIDHQVGLLLGVHDHDQEELRRNAIGLAKAATACQLPTVTTTSADDGPNGELLRQLAAALPGAPVIRRPGEIDAFDNADFAAAVKDTGRDQLIIVGISTDVCVTFAALSACAFARLSLCSFVRILFALEMLSQAGHPFVRSLLSTNTSGVSFRHGTESLPCFSLFGAKYSTS